MHRVQGNTESTELCHFVFVTMLLTKLGVYSENVRNGMQEGTAREGTYSEGKASLLTHF